MQMWGGTCLHPHRLMLLSLQVHMWIIVVYALKSCINIAESMEDKRKPHFTVLPKVTGLTKNREGPNLCICVTYVLCICLTYVLCICILMSFAYVSLMSFAYVSFISYSYLFGPKRKINKAKNRNSNAGGLIHFIGLSATSHRLFWSDNCSIQIIWACFHSLHVRNLLPSEG